ncbi:metalloregulator ArsR/SmtB family transcription factor [Propylenella binzhouense]|uniref:ArsR/SmtB family transcription factor n=1 Tax=Propylenella binzhouense TaxID=2555902 RepID=UPI0031B5D235
MGSSVGKLVTRLKAAGEPSRLRLLSLLAAGERTVKDLTDILGQSQPRISRHLKILSDAGLVARNPEGSWVYYRLAEDDAELAQALVAGLDPDDPIIRRDRERLQAIRRQAQEHAERYFGQHAGEWDRIRSLHVPEREVESAILAAAGPGPFRSMLDIGTGTGRMLELFAERYERGLGIDLSPAMLAVARSKLERAGIGHARVRLGDITNLPVLRESFDLVVIHQVLHFVENPQRAIAEAAAALAPDGRLLVIDFAPHQLEFLREEHAHRRLGFAHGQMAQWIAAAGLNLASAQDLGPKPGAGPGLTVTIWSADRAQIARTTQTEAGETVR